MKSRLRRWFWKAALFVGCPALLVGAGYGWLLKSRLQTTLASAGAENYAVGAFELVEPSATNVRSALPRVLRVAPRRTDGPNYRVFREKLVQGVYDWSPGSFQWVEVSPSVSEQTESLKLHALEALTPGQHIERLTDADEHVRQVASELLRARTGQDFGFHPEEPPGTQGEAIERWRKWWELNKLSWSMGKAIEGFEGVLKKTSP